MSRCAAMTRAAQLLSLCGGFAWLCLVLPGCGRGGHGHALVLAGSTSVQPIAELIAEHYELEHHDRPVNVQGGGSTAGVKAATEGAADIGMSSRKLKDDEKDLEAIAIAMDAVALVVNPANPITDLSKEQVAGIYVGDLTRWGELGVEGLIGGRTDAITVVTREEGSGTRSAFEEGVMGKADISPRALVQDSTGTVRAIVASDPNAIGYISLGMVTSEVKAVTYNGVLPCEQTVESGAYALARPFLFLTRGAPSRAAQDFIDYALGVEGQRLVVQAGCVPVGGESE